MFIYHIKNTINGKKYIGQTSWKGKRRWVQHRGDLRGNRHGNIHLQRAWNKYGEAAFEFKIIDFPLSPSQTALDMLECRHIALNPNNYNIKGGGLAHPIMSAESRAKMSAAKKGKTWTAERRAAFVPPDWNGKHHSEESKAKMSKARKGKKFSEEARKNMSVGKLGNTNRRGKKSSKETRAKQSAAMLGNKNGLGCKFSEEVRAKMSSSRKGRKYSDEAKANMSAAQYKRWNPELTEKS